MERKFPLPAFPQVHIKGLLPGFWSNGVEMFEKVAEVVRASQGGAREVVLIGDTRYNPPFGLWL